MSQRSKIKLLKEREQLKEQLQSKKKALSEISENVRKFRKTTQVQMGSILSLSENRKPLEIPNTKDNGIRHEIKSIQLMFKDLQVSNQNKSTYSIAYSPAFSIEEIKENASLTEYSQYLDSLENWLQKQEEIQKQKLLKRQELIDNIKLLKNKQLKLTNQINEYPDLDEEINHIENELYSKNEILSQKEELLDSHRNLSKQINSYYLLSSQADESQKQDYEVQCKIKSENELISEYRRIWREKRRLKEKAKIIEEKRKLATNILLCALAQNGFNNNM